MECFRYVLLFIILVINCLATSQHHQGPFRNYEISEVVEVAFKETDKPEHLFSLQAFGTTFKLTVVKVDAPIHPEFKLLIGDKENAEFSSGSTHYEGHLIDNPSSKVLITKSDTGSVFGSIEVDGDSIRFEPANIHFPNYDESKVVVYKASEVNWEPIIHSFRNYSHIQIKDAVHHASKSKHSKDKEKRYKREVSYGNEKLNRCPIKVVADFKFFSSVGRSQHSHTYRYIVNMISQVNEIFRRVDWDEDENIEGLERGRFTNMGFQIKEIRILDTTSNTQGHYNSLDPDGKNSTNRWNSKSLLEAFTKDEGSEKFCLVHLLTAQSFGQDEIVLGIAYVASPQNPSAGVCGTHPYGRLHNALLTSAVNGGSALASKGHEIVVAHEYGHSWGAAHDNNTDPICSPSFEEGGKYIMDEFGQSGLYPNNVIFSSCSRKAVRAILNKRWKRCFEEERFSFCGNGVLEVGEECDEGSQYGVHNSTCCTQNCRLIPGAICSPINKPCCNMNCAFHPATHKCDGRNEWQCKMESFCTGKSAECPVSQPVKDGIKCAEDGRCHAGHCTPYCELHNKTSCICEDVNMSCKRCCHEEDGTCAPQPGTRDLPDGTTCSKGSCKNSKCMSDSTDYIFHFWQNIQDNERRWHYVKSNLVGIVVIIMTIIWCSVGRLILRFDERRKNAVKNANDVLQVDCREIPMGNDAQVYPASPSSAPSVAQTVVPDFDPRDIGGL